VLGARGFWRWDFAMRSVSDNNPLAGDFWRRMMRWLAEPSQRERFTVNPARRVFQDSEALAFSARLYDEAYKPIPGARIELTIETATTLDGTTAPPDGPVRIQLYPDGPAGRYAGTAAPLPPGMYRFQAVAEGQESSRRRVGNGSGLFWVEQMGPEFFDLAASRRLPALLADASGGTVVGPDQLAGLVDV
ncbi:MAG: carboxypeptidase regulatory-like domain-containing protein, partial [bacterium]|nr:carboxypeptidase regulatory-like domain-containing protein [bacterium]